MKNPLLQFCAFLLFVLSSCGVSKEQEEQMQQSLEVALSEIFFEEGDFIATDMTVELSNVEKGGSMWNSAFSCSFSCSFENDGVPVRLSGMAGFSEDGLVMELPNEKVAILVSPQIIVDNECIPLGSTNYKMPSFY